MSMELKFWLLFLCLQVIPHVQSSKNTWTASVPPRIPAVQGHCVVIPCTYTCPKIKTTVNWWTGFWKKGKQIISSSIPQWKLPKEYRHRTVFLGDLRSGTCSMLLAGVRSTDTGPFYFRIKRPLYMYFSFINNAVTIDVIRDPEPPSLSVQVRGRVTATCSVTHSCPVMPPKLSWNHRGLTTRRIKKPNEWQREMTSTLTFSPLFTDFNKTLTCTVTYRGGKQAQSSTTIKM